MTEIARTSPLSQRSTPGKAAGYSITFTEVADRAMIDVRGRTGDAKFMKAAEDLLGFRLPAEPRTSVSGDGIAALWLSIDQWMLTAPLSRRNEILETLRKSTSRLFVLVTDLSDARAIIRLEGGGVREVLMKGTSVDFTSLGRGTVRRIQFAEIAGMCHIVETESDVIDLYVYRSYADYAWEWLEATAGENSRVSLFGPLRVPTSKAGA